MPLDTGRFRDSDLVTIESPEAVLAALHLWMTAWHQLPAASLPDDDRLLARYAGYGRAVDAWLAVRPGALRGFVLCSDGRLYHRVLAEKANDAWDKRLRYEWGKAGDRHRKAQKKLPEAERSDFPEFEDWKAGRPIAPPAPPRQADLPLETPQAFRRNDPSIPAEQSSERARAERAPAHTERARTGASTVPDANSDGNTDTFQRNGHAIPTENALKGREGKGRDNIDSTQPTESPEPAKLSRLDDRDLQALYDAVCEAAGFATSSPGGIDRAYRQVQAWRDAGIDFEEVVLPTIRHTVANTPEPTRVLGRFDKAIRHEHARKVAKAATGGPYVPPPSPVTVRDDEEPVFALIRQELLERLGPSSYCTYANQIRMEAVEMGDAPGRDGQPRKPIQVHEANAGYAKFMDSDRPAILLHIAKRHGFNEVW